MLLFLIFIPLFTGNYEVRNISEVYVPLANMPLEYYDFLRDIPMNNKELLSTKDFRTFINRLEFCQPLIRYGYRAFFKETKPKKNFMQYLFEELKIPKTPEDEPYLRMLNFINDTTTTTTTTTTIRLVKELNSQEAKEMDEFNNAAPTLEKRYEKQYEDYKKKYLPTQEDEEIKKWQIKDSVYINVLKLKPGIVYDVTKIRSLDYAFSESLKNNKEAAWNVLTALTSNIPESFLRSEADRLFLKNFPEEQRTAYKLPDTYEAKIFKDLITSFKGKFLLVDFWATTCGPCVYNIRQHKTLREQYKDNPNVDFVFITSEGESPLNAYNNFVKEQELKNTYRINADQYRYLRQLFRFNGIPRYVLVDKEGKIMDDNYNARSNLDEKLKELTKKGL